MNTVAIYNQKGGTGKTTTAVSLAACLAEVGDRCLVVDLDPQRTASWWLGSSEDVPGRSVRAVFDGGCASDAIEASPVEGVDLLPSSETIAFAEPDWGVFQGVFETTDYDWVFFDSPPKLGHLSMVALFAADYVLAPLRPDSSDLQGLARLEATVDHAREAGGGAILIGPVLCQVRRNTNVANKARRRLDERFGDEVFDSEVYQNVRLGESHEYQQPITEYAPDSTGAECYRALAKELKGRLQ